MRIIGGTYRARRLVPPADARVRPTADRVREAWMSIIADRLPGARVLDLFAGSGALGLEALSRGARTAEFVELNPASIKALRANIDALGVGDRAAVRRADAVRFVAKVEPGTYDLCFADPPYSSDAAARLAVLFRTAPFAHLLMIEHDASVAVQGGETRRYGDTAITFLAPGDDVNDSLSTPVRQPS